MKKIAICFLSLLIAVFSVELAGAWSTANRFGGSTTHTYGETSHTNMYGGSTQHAYGEGTQHTNMYGGSTSHGWYGGTTHTNVYGGTTSGAYGAGVYHTYPSGASYYHPPYPAYHPAYPVYPYHPPVAVPYYSAAGCYGCAAAAGAVVGMATGAAVASASTAAAASTAYSSGYAAGSATTAATMSGAAPVVASSAPITYAMGGNYAMLPAGCATPDVGGRTYFLCSNTWFQPLYGANGIYYHVVPTP